MSRSSVYEAPPAFVLELLRAAECVAASVQNEQIPCPKLPDDLQEPLNSPSNQPGTEQANLDSTDATSWDNFQQTNGLVSTDGGSPSTAANTDSLQYSLITSLLATLSQNELSGALQSSIDSAARHQTSLGNTPTASLPENSETGLQLMNDTAVLQSSNTDFNNQQQNISQDKANSCLVPVTMCGQLEEGISDANCSKLGGNRSISPTGPESSSNILISYENRENFPSSLLQEHPVNHVLNEGKCSLIQKSPMSNGKFTLIPGPSPIMSPKEIPSSMKYDHPASRSMVDYFHGNNTITIATTAGTFPKHTEKILGKKRVKPYSNGERSSKEFKVLGHNDGKIKSYTKRARFARCSKKLKYLCSVCSKPDCMKCTHCINRSTGHQACLEKPKEQCLSYIKMLREMESHPNPEDKNEDCEGIGLALAQ